jgi:hypothetical protein
MYTYLSVDEKNEQIFFLFNCDEQLDTLLLSIEVRISISNVINQLND